MAASLASYRIDVATCCGLPDCSFPKLVGDMGVLTQLIGADKDDIEAHRMADEACLTRIDSNLPTVPEHCQNHADGAIERRASS